MNSFPDIDYLLYNSDGYMGSRSGYLNFVREYVEKLTKINSHNKHGHLKRRIFKEFIYHDSEEKKLFTEAYDHLKKYLLSCANEILLKHKHDLILCWINTKFKLPKVLLKYKISNDFEYEFILNKSIPMIITRLGKFLFGDQARYTSSFYAYSICSEKIG